MKRSQRYVLPLLGLALAVGGGLQWQAARTAATAPSAGTVVVYKSPTCGCCTSWEEHLREHGYEVESHLSNDMASVKGQLGVPAELASCHTAVIDGYVLEGHVPAEAIDRLLAQGPDAHGLFVPGMPLGSPGMEVPSGEVEPYDVILMDAGGERSTWMSMR